MLGRKGRPRNSRGDTWGGPRKNEWRNSTPGVLPLAGHLFPSGSAPTLHHPIALGDKREPRTPGVTRAPSVGWGQVCRREGSDRSAGKPH